MGRSGGVEEWRSGGVEEWWSGGVEEWRSGGVEEWRSGGVEEWRSEAVKQPTPAWADGRTDGRMDGLSVKMYFYTVSIGRINCCFFFYHTLIM